MFQMTTTLFRMATPENISRSLSEAIKDAASESKVSQRDLASRTGIPLVTLNRKLNHASPFNFMELGAISEVLGVSLTELVLRAERQAIAA